MRNTIKSTALAAAMAFVALGGAGAQQAGTAAHWQAWLGCWTASAPGTAYGSAQFAAPIVCVVPTSNADVVEIATIADGKVIKRDSIDASGREKALRSPDCEGVQMARWSADGRRAYLSSTSSCSGLVTKATSILAVTPAGDWLDIRGVAAGGGENVRVARYRDIGIPNSVPADIAEVLRGRSMSSLSARVAAGATIGTAAVTEATRLSNASVVQAWLLERGQRFSLNANELVALADAGMPAGVTDALVAVSYPDAFQVARADDNALNSDEVDSRSRRVVPVYLDPYYSPYDWGYSRYGYDRYGSPYGYGYGGVGGYGGYNGGYSGPIVIVTGTQSAGGGSSQMVKGQGYTENRPSSSSGRSASPNAPSPSAGSSGSSSSSGQSQGQTQQPSQPAESRTAKPRP